MTDNPGATAPAPVGRLDRILNAIPVALSSKPHIAWLLVLLLWIVVLAVPFPSIASARVELILGNYTNVTSALGACIAAGGTVTLLHHARRQSRLAEERHRLTAEMHHLLVLAHPEHAAALGIATSSGDAHPPDAGPVTSDGDS